MYKWVKESKEGSKFEAYSLKGTKLNLYITNGHIEYPNTWVLVWDQLKGGKTELHVDTVKQARAAALLVVKHAIEQYVSDLNHIETDQFWKRYYKSN